jgi:hypothetical protein
MKKKIFFSLLGVMLLLIPGALWAGNQNDVSQDTPAILVSLGQANAIPLDDVAAATVRGQAQYVLVKVFGLNMFDGWGQKDISWTWNPLGYRYGNWGGPGWSGQDGGPVDTMDGYFKAHDNGVAYQIPGVPLGTSNDAALLGLLNSLAATPSGTIWGNIYVSTASGLPSDVNVFGFSLIGGKIFTKPIPMPYEEYSRREAVYGMQLLIAGKAILKIN